MNDINPCFAVTVIVFAVYLLLAVLGSRERNEAVPDLARKLRRRLREWTSRAHSCRQIY